MLHDYRHDQPVQCPYDRAELQVVTVAAAPPPPLVRITCPECGNSFVSDAIEESPK
jgi:hypothetical protein